MTNPARTTLNRELVSAAREYSSATVFLHAAVASSLGLSVSDLKALDLIQRSTNCTARDVASVTGLSNSAVTALLDRLEHRGFIRRTRGSPDRRVVRVRLTPLFRRTLPRRFGSLERRVAASWSGLTDGELKLALKFLRGVAAAVREELTAAHLLGQGGGGGLPRAGAAPAGDRPGPTTGAPIRGRPSPRTPSMAGR